MVMYNDVIAERQVDLAVRQINTAFAVLTEKQKLLATKRLVEYVRESVVKLEREAV